MTKSSRPAARGRSKVLTREKRKSGMCGRRRHRRRVNPGAKACACGEQRKDQRLLRRSLPSLSGSLRARLTHDRQVVWCDDVQVFSASAANTRPRIQNAVAVPESPNNPVRQNTTDAIMNITADICRDPNSISSRFQVSDGCGSAPSQSRDSIAAQTTRADGPQRAGSGRSRPKAPRQLDPFQPPTSAAHPSDHLFAHRFFRVALIRVALALPG